METRTSPRKDRRGSLRESITSQDSVKSRTLNNKRWSLQDRNFYRIAQPAVHWCMKCKRMRPRLVLQLQQVSSTGRPMILLNLFPSTVLLPFLARAFTLFFGGRWKCLGPGNLIVMQSKVFASDLKEDCPTRKSGKKGDGDIVAKICTRKSSKTKNQKETSIHFTSGNTCTIRGNSIGSYDLVYRREHDTQKMQWKLQFNNSNNRKRRSSTSTLPDRSKISFNFLCADPSTRRYVVVAIMTKERIEVSRNFGNQSIEKESMSQIDEELNTLILVSGLWIALHEKW